MKTKTITASILAAVAITATSAEVYRLKLPATVDIVEDGEVTGTKKLKAGTLVALAEETPAADAQEKAPAPTAGKLRVSKLSPIMFKNTHPAVAHVFNAEVELNDYYTGPFEGKGDLFWNVRVCAYSQNWKSMEIWQGYARKTDAIGRQVKALLEDGERKTVHIKLSWVKGKDADDLVMVEAIEPATRPE